MPEPVAFRAHHFLCALGFEGKGYSDRFTANMARIVEGLRAAPETVIEVVAQADDICAPCPKRRGEGCLNQTRITALDTRHAEALGLTPGDRLSWTDAQTRIRARIEVRTLDTICAGCAWLDQGMCRNAVSRLRAD